jgi:hypothetical protein
MATGHMDHRSFRPVNRSCNTFISRRPRLLASLLDSRKEDHAGRGGPRTTSRPTSLSPSAYGGKAG